MTEVLRPLRTATQTGDEHRYELRRPALGQPGRLALDDEVISQSPDAALLYATLLWHVNRGVERASRGHVLLHAAAAERDGAAVLLVAPSGKGKSTLVAGLVRAGLRYLTDEAVALRPCDGGITPYPKSLSIEQGSWDVLADLRQHVPVSSTSLSPEQWQVPVDALRPDAVSAGARTTLVVLPRYEAGAASTLTPLRRSDVLVQLMDQRFAPDRDRPRDFAVLADVVRGSACYGLLSGFLPGAVGLVVGALDSTT